MTAPQTILDDTVNLWRPKKAVGLCHLLLLPDVSGAANAEDWSTWITDFTPRTGAEATGRGGVGPRSSAVGEMRRLSRTWDSPFGGIHSPLRSSKLHLVTPDLGGVVPPR